MIVTPSYCSETLINACKYREKEAVYCCRKTEIIENDLEKTLHERSGVFVFSILHYFGMLFLTL